MKDEINIFCTQGAQNRLESLNAPTEARDLPYREQGEFYVAPDAQTAGRCPAHLAAVMACNGTGASQF